MEKADRSASTGASISGLGEGKIMAENHKMGIKRAKLMQLNKKGGKIRGGGRGLEALRSFVRQNGKFYEHKVK